ncbi:MAG: hypothetical protein JWM57_605 [Phycisphaerales bacterium]|nr:hypothetical protein [Phycisphaerales bacterium]
MKSRRSNWRSHFSGMGFLVLMLLSSSAAVQAASPFPAAPEWVKDQAVYEVNLRQFSASGDVAGLQKQLPRLKALGVGILWIMPVNPIGLEGRSGKLGSPYAVKDYSAFNPEFGTLEQFKALIAEAHGMGFHVILDWVANHTALEHPWVKSHPDWFKHDASGRLVHPLPEWKDVAALNYANADLRKAMIDAMAFWVRDVGVDGFRCDTAEWVPLDFWCEARDALRAIKPVYLLAEGDKPELMNYAFDSAYAWNLPANTEGILKGSKSVPDLCNFIRAEQQIVPAGRYRLFFTSNHDKNSWEGTTREQLGDGAPAFAVLTFTLPGLPLIYNGQESGGAEHRLSFFEHDPIQWRDDPAADLYRSLTNLKREHAALWVGATVSPVSFIDGSNNGTVLAFQREGAGDRVVVLMNLSAQTAKAVVPREVAGLHPVLGTSQPAAAGAMIDLHPWEYRAWATPRP